VTVRILTGDCLSILPTLEDKSVQTCVTSPPYFGLRDYGTASWNGGDPECTHQKETRHQSQGATSQRTGRANVESQRSENVMQTCEQCGAVRVDKQIGLEASPHEYVEKLVTVFREVRRVLKDDGTLWLNLGDSYANDGKWGGSTGGLHASELHGTSVGRTKRKTGLKPKDLIGIPWRVAFALQDDGWYLRMDVIWSKLQPMPESVTDRPTRAHEYLFLLAKNERYFYDAAAIAERSVTGDRRRPYAPGQVDERGDGHDRGGGGIRQLDSAPLTRNKRSVWTIASEPFVGAHFAVMPSALVIPCILAGSRIGDVVLDPFGGSGTVGVVATELGRHATLVELNPKYVAIAEQRTVQESLFASSDRREEVG